MAEMDKMQETRGMSLAALERRQREINEELNRRRAEQYGSRERNPRWLGAIAMVALGVVTGLLLWRIDRPHSVPEAHAEFLNIAEIAARPDGRATLTAMGYDLGQQQEIVVEMQADPEYSAEAAPYATAFAESAQPEYGVAEGVLSCRHTANMPATVLHWCDHIDAAARNPLVAIDPRALAILVLIESEGIQQARSGAGAMGLTQVMPETGRILAAETGLPCVEQAYDPDTSLVCGGRYFSQSMDKAAKILGGERGPAEIVGLAYAGHNAGHGVVDRWGREALQTGQPVCEIPSMYEESRRGCRVAQDLWAETEMHALTIAEQESP